MRPDPRSGRASTRLRDYALAVLLVAGATWVELIAFRSSSLTPSVTSLSLAGALLIWIIAFAEYAHRRRRHDTTLRKAAEDAAVQANRITQLTAALSHAVLIANMPCIGPRYQVGPAAAPDDGLLDVLVFADLSKLDLLSYAVQEVVAGGVSDPRIQYHRVRRLAIEAEPAMPILADGVALGAGPLRIEVRPRALAIMAGPAPAASGRGLPAAAAESKGGGCGGRRLVTRFCIGWSATHGQNLP